jgi:uncharacterized protein YigE (DUF2233 family)
MKGTAGAKVPTDAGGDSPLPRPARRKLARAGRRRRILLVVLVLVVGLLVPVGISLGSALNDPANGSSVGARAAEWFRGHGAESVVNWIENVWYTHHQPPIGGRPPKGEIRVPKQPVTAIAVGPAHLPPPPPIVPLASPALPGEGQWSPAGRMVEGVPAVYETELRPDPVHTSQVVGVAWMDTMLLDATLYSGNIIPGGGPFTHTAPIQSDAATSLVAVFNAGFLMANADGGYYTDGRTEIPLRDGAASFVVYANGTATVGEWGRDVTMTPDVVSVRQNLDLLVDGGQPVPGLDANDITRWGFTLGNQVYVWRSGVGVTADGALVYVGGPSLNITSLANVLAAAGCVRAMELDINTDWVNMATYDPAVGQPASPSNGANLLSTMTGGTGRYFQSYWERDFITMSSAYGAAQSVPAPTTTTTAPSGKSKGAKTKSTAGG